MRGGSRFNRLLAQMTEAEAIKAGLDDHRDHFRIAEIEANLAPPSSTRNRWFRKIGVDLPNGATVAAVELWSWPDPFEGVTVEMAAAVLAALGELDPPARASAQSPEWAGYVVARICGFEISPSDPDEERKKARAKELLANWIANGVLKVDRTIDKHSKARPVIVAGANNPTELTQ